MPTDTTVRVHIPSRNTKMLTELCIRTAHRFAGHPFELVVGDCFSSDGSIAMLERMAGRGWIDDFQRTHPPVGSGHHNWLNVWSQQCRAGYAVFLHCDVSFRSGPWLAELVDMARGAGAAVVAPYQDPEIAGYVDPRSGRQVRVPARPATHAFLVDTDVLAQIDTPFDPRYVDRDDLPEGAMYLDTAVAFFQQVEAAGLPIAYMPEEWNAKVRHIGGASYREQTSMAERLRLLKLRAGLASYRATWRMDPSAVRRGG